jgi:hypothetical protein
MIYFKNGHEIRAWVSPDGKSMHASISTKPGPHGSMRNFNTADGQYVAGDAPLTESGQIVSDAGGIFGGSEVRGPGRRRNRRNTRLCLQPRRSRT